MTEDGHRWRARVARRLDPHLAADRDELAASVDELAFERDELVEQREGLRERIAALESRLTAERDRCAILERRAEGQWFQLKAEIAKLLEPVEVGTCRKVRYLQRSDAEVHASHIASTFPGEIFGVYACRSCPSYSGPFKDMKPWHVGHRELGEGAFWVDDEGLHRPGWPVMPPVAVPTILRKQVAPPAAPTPKGTIHMPMAPEREALVPRVMEVLIANGPDGDPLSPGEVCARLGLDPEEEILVFKALRASRKRGYALLAPDTQSGTYLCVPGATVPQLVTPERTA
jgi:hypothetical protein